MKNIVLLLILSFALFSCSKDKSEDLKEEDEKKENPMSLKVVNELKSHYYITSVKLVGYEFESLNIKGGESQVFELKDGMPGGLDNINVIVAYRSSPYSIWRVNESIDFKKSGTTTVTLGGCTAEGCDGIRLVQ